MSSLVRLRAGSTQKVPLSGVFRMKDAVCGYCTTNGVRLQFYFRFFNGIFCLFCDRGKHVNGILLAEASAMFLQVRNGALIFHTGSEFPDEKVFPQVSCLFAL